MKTYACLLAFLISSAVQAQDLPQIPMRQDTPGLTFETPQSVATDAWQEPAKPVESAPAFGTRIVRPEVNVTGLYYSNSLKAYFRAEYMYIMIFGQRHEFWGARIYAFKADEPSPLRQLALQPGDIITRLDGFPIWEGLRFNGNGTMEIPELERHVGVTDVRYIRLREKFVSTGKIVISNGPFHVQGEVLMP